MENRAGHVVTGCVARRLLSRVRKALRDRAGFGLVELLIAMMLLNVGLIALLEQNLVDAALREGARLRAELAPILAEARRRLHEARR